MTTTFKIISINSVNRCMLIDWGFTRLNHTIPAQILENQEIDANTVIEIIQSMAPPTPVGIIIPPSLLSLVADPSTINDFLDIPNELIL